MPLYDYKCPQGHHWDAQRPIVKRNAPIACPECGADGKLSFMKAPLVPWFPGTTRSPYREKQRNSY